MSEPLLSVRGLTVEFETDDGIVQAVNDLTYEVFPGETLGVVGESGSGKTASGLALLGLIPDTVGRVVRGEAWFKGRDLLELKSSELRRLRGRELGIIFQDPMTSLNPVQTIGAQISETLKIHRSDLRRAGRREEALRLLRLVGIPEAEKRITQYPHEFSGGMRQRTMIAIAIANNPSLLIADEPTTALDVTIQAQILDVLARAKQETNAAVILITHDLGLVSQICDRVLVVYAGRVVETGDVFEIFESPLHPYTLGLLKSTPKLSGDIAWLEPIPGQPPNPIQLPSGCVFHPRCALRNWRDRCIEEVPELRTAIGDHSSACHFYEELPYSTERKGTRPTSYPANE